MEREEQVGKKEKNRAVGSLVRKLRVIEINTQRHRVMGQAQVVKLFIKEKEGVQKQM
jgi:hypothetical protein